MSDNNNKFMIIGTKRETGDFMTALCPMNRWIWVTEQELFESALILSEEEACKVASMYSADNVRVVSVADVKRDLLECMLHS